MHAPAISHYAIIGNGHTAALVSLDGSIDWCCWPRFDSPAVFCRLLDTRQGGFFQIAPRHPHSSQREYVAGTNILQTTFKVKSGSLRLTDWMPVADDDDGNMQHPQRISRRLDCVDGEVEVEVRLRPSFSFARTAANFMIDAERGGLALGGDDALGLVSPITVRQEERELVGRRRLHAGDTCWFSLTYGAAADASTLLSAEANSIAKEYARTEEQWQSWTRECTYDGLYEEQVKRSALTLKLLAYVPTGGLIAAPTTSLPAELGGTRNWDYRYTWLRDSGLVLDALQQLGYHQDSKRFIDWLGELCGDPHEDLRIVYRVDGSPAPQESALPHLSGYRDSQPVNIGNAATDQRQIDSLGHVLDAVVLCFERMPRELSPELWRLLAALADRAAQQWRNKDHGPWEQRGDPQNFLYSKLYCWVGLDRAIRMAERRQLKGNIEHWKQQRTEIRKAILTQGFNSRLGAFTQSFESKCLDAAALTIPLTGFLAGDDPRVVSTMEAIQKNLTSNGLVYRYQMDDGLPGKDATFTLCSYWLVMNLALAGRVREAQELFEHITSFANDVGLLSEQIDPHSGLLLGNFPQGFTHLGMIRAALHLNNAMHKQR